MKLYVFILLLVFFSSCKKDTEKAKSEDTIAVKIDTVYCNYNKVPTTDTIETSMFNEPYKCFIKTSSLLDEKIISQDDNQINICYDKSAKITLLQERDTIFNVNVDMNLLEKEYKTFYADYLENLKKSENNFPNVDIPKPTESLKLDSLKHNGARSSHIYFTCYHTDYNTGKRYKSDIGIDYLDEKGKSILTSQLLELN